MAARWVDQRVETLKRLWGEGKTASEIADALGGGVTRNMVIGKAHRLGLEARPSPIVRNGGELSNYGGLNQMEPE